MKNVNLKLGTGDVGGGSHESPEVRRLVKAAATFRAGGLNVKNRRVFLNYRYILGN